MNIPVSDFFKGQLHTQITLPMRWSGVNDAERQDFTRHNLTVLNLWLSNTELASHHADTHESHSAEMIRIEQKLDLIINLFQQLLASQTNNNLNLSATLISIAGISWIATAPQLQTGQSLLIELSLGAAHSPICLYAKVVTLDSLNGGILCTARFEEQNEEVLSLMEKWIFNLHRREIANLRQK